MSKAPASRKQPSTESQMISSFEGYYSFLSNDYPTWVYFQGLAFASVSTAFQAARTEDPALRDKIAKAVDVEQFKSLAMSIKNPADWSQRREKVMENLVRDKFKRNKEIAQKLMSTKDKKLINGMKNSGINEQYWGMFQNKGRNTLGRILMSIRDQFMKGIDTKQWIQCNLNLQTDKHMLAKVTLMVCKDGKKVQKLQLDKHKNYYLFGSLKTVDFHLENPTISRNHACIYFTTDLQVMLVDLNSTQHTYLRRKGQKQQLEGLVGYRLYKDDVIMFGTSAREYVVDIVRTEVEKYIAESEADMQVQAKSERVNGVEAAKFEDLGKDEAKNLLGLVNKCILVENIGEADTYAKLREVFGKYERVKTVRIKINHKTGKNETVAVVFFEQQSAIPNIMNRRKELDYKIREIRESDADELLNNRSERERSRSRSRQKRHHAGHRG